jgi:UDP-N-acetylglucosamine transferase subunit ALG13
MIFLTIGTTESFDRLVSAMDNIATEIRDVPILAQISNSSYKIKNMESIGFISPLKYRELFDKASLIVSHAGMGTILSALQKGKSIIVMPRRADLNEVKNNHQLATAKKLAALNLIQVANNELELLELIKFHKIQIQSSTPKIGPFASISLIASLKNYINS